MMIIGVGLQHVQTHSKQKLPELLDFEKCHFKSQIHQRELPKTKTISVSSENMLILKFVTESTVTS